jgi:formimidoylglutamate deiminase
MTPPTPPLRALRAALILTPQGVLSDQVLEVGHDGRIAALRPARAAETHLLDLGAVALVPGLVNVHSHAFQRGLRDRTEFVEAAHPEADFWSWRDRMFRTSLTLSPDEVEAISAQAFLEMALSGITTVGEFHYLHHAPDGTPYADPNALAHRVIAAARRVGIRIHLLRVLYHRAGPGRAAEPEQRRFVDPTVEVALERVEALAARWQGVAGVQVGVAPHSVRAVPGPWLDATADFAVQRDLALHLHACEQRRELVECRAEYGMEPVALLAQRGLLGPRTTLVHGTHLNAAALDLLGQHRPTICACPTTERNLGDGFLMVEDLLARGVPIALGTDSQARIDLWEELRAVEGHARLRAEKRNVLARFAEPDARDNLSVGSVLWPLATTNGHRALAGPGGLDPLAGTLSVGAPADFVALDLNDPALLGTTAQSLETALCFSTERSAVRGVWVGGQAIIAEGRHAQQSKIAADFLKAMARLDGP